MGDDLIRTLLKERRNFIKVVVSVSVSVITLLIFIIRDRSLVKMTSIARAYCIFFLNSLATREWFISWDFISLYK